MRGMHHIPVDRSAGADAYEDALDALRDGEVIGVFRRRRLAEHFSSRT